MNSVYSGCTAWSLDQQATLPFPQIDSLDICLSTCHQHNITQCGYASAIQDTFGNETMALSAHCIGFYSSFVDKIDPSYCHIPCDSEPSLMCGGFPIGEAYILSVFTLDAPVMNDNNHTLSESPRPPTNTTLGDIKMNGSDGVLDSMNTTSSTTTSSSSTRTRTSTTTTTTSSTSATAILVTSSPLPTNQPNPSYQESPDMTGQVVIVIAALVATALILGIIILTARCMLKKKKASSMKDMPFSLEAPKRTVSHV